jgi:heptosyltransferase-2
MRPQHIVEDSNTVKLGPDAAQNAALGMLVKVSPRKRLLIRGLDVVAEPVVHVTERLFRRRSMDQEREQEAEKILVMEYWNLGDIVMLSPFLRSLRIQFPKAHITLLTSPKAAPILEHQGLVDEVMVVRVPWAQHYSRSKKYNPFSLLWVELLRTLKSLRLRKIDLAFVARADIRDNFMLWFARIERRVGYGFGGGSYFLTDVVIPDLQHPHFSNRWLRLLNAVGKNPIIREPRLAVTPEEQELAENVLAKQGIHRGEFLIGIHPGARSELRMWGEQNFLALAERLQKEFPIKIIWFLDPGQQTPLGNGVCRHFVSLPLRQFMGVLARCQMLICNDSGPMHIATALEVPVVAIFGPTEPAWFGPIGKQHRVVLQPGFWCRPCFDYCHFDQPYCLRTVAVESVFQAAARSLSVLLGRSREASDLLEQPASKAATPE